jgi:hypothetical protein
MKTNQIPDVSALCYIREEATPAANSIADLGYKVHDRGNRFFLTFDATLQSFGVLNRNKRSYIQENVKEKIESDIYVQDQLRKNSWIGEWDHPNAEIKGEELSVQRVGNPDPKVSSHFIRRPRFESNLIKAPIQTDSSNPNGMNFAIKIVDGGIVPCFSVRVFGELRENASMPQVFVKRLITYDAVLFPSHPEAEASIKPGILQESVDFMQNAIQSTIIFFKELAQMAANKLVQPELLCESFGLTIDDVVGVTESGNSLVIQEGSNLYVQPITDKFVRHSTQKLVKDFMKS